MPLYLKAYQAYHIKNYDKCLRILDEIKSSETRKLDLQAQVYFQKKEYQKAYDIYQELIAAKPDQFTAEREENLLTIIACAQLEQPGSLKSKTKEKFPDAATIVDQVLRIELIDESVNDSELLLPKSTKKRNKKRRRAYLKFRKISSPYNPDMISDPERWLPLRDRKGALHKQKQKRRQRTNNPKGKARRR